MLKIVKALDVVLGAIAGTALIAMMLLTIANALTRTWFQAPIPMANEIVAQWMLPTLVLLSIPTAQIWKEHLNVTLFLTQMNPLSLGLIKVVAYSVSAILCAGLAWFGFGEAMHQMSILSVAGLTHLPLWPFYFLVPIGFTIATFVFIVDAFLVFRDPAEDLNTATGKPLNVSEEEAVL